MGVEDVPSLFYKKTITGEMNRIGAVCMTYNEIKKQVKRKSGITIHHPCWIAKVKRRHGLTRGPAWNRGQGMGAPACPQDVFRVIEEVLRDNGEI